MISGQMRATGSMTTAGRDRVRVLLVSSHPVQYAAPCYRLYSADPRLDVTVAYCSLQGAEPGPDPEFGVSVAWDVPLLEGYRWVHPPNHSPRPGLRGFWGLINPGLWRLVREGGYAVVVCYGHRAASFWIAALAAKASGAALVLTTDAHTLVPRDGRRWKVPLKRQVLPRVYDLANGVLAPSSRTVRFLEKLGVPADRIFLTPFVVDTKFFAKAALLTEREVTRRKLDIAPEAPAVVFSGKLVPWKRPEDLLEAAAQVPDVHVVYAGDGSLRSTLEARARDLGMAQRVRFLGFVNQRGLPEVYAAADFLMLPSEHEPFGLVVNEAFACGLPAIVSEACGAVGDLVQDGETGFVVQVGDTQALADRMCLLASDHEMRRVMGEKARARIAEWGPEQNAEAFTRACLELARRRGTGT